MFIILNQDTGVIFDSNNSKMLNQIQEEVGFHPSENCGLMIYDYGDLAMENSCGNIKDLPPKYALIEYREDVG